MANDPIGTEYKGAPEKAPSGAYYKGVDGRYYVWKNGTAASGGPVWVVQNDDPAMQLGAFGAYKLRGDEIPSSAPNSPNVPVAESEESVAPDPMAVAYPSDMSIGYDSDYVVFDFYQYNPPFNNAIKAQNKNLVNTSGEVALNQTLDAYNATGTAANYDKDPKFPQLRLYMPSDVQDAYKADWQGKAFGGATAGILAAAGAEGFGRKIEDTFKQLGESIGRAPVNAAAAAITGLSSSITGDSITTDDVFGGISGVVRNPNTELLFEKMNLRTFDLTFKMAPYSTQDTYNISSIIKVFKMAMLPTYQMGSDTSVFGFAPGDNKALQAGFIKVPRVCQVTYMRGSNAHPYLPKYKMCAITDFKVNYTPENSYSTLTDSFPVAVEIKISFLETKLVFADDVDPNIALNGTIAYDSEGNYIGTTAPKGQEAGPMASDSRLKENIVRVGNSPSGLNIYEWNYKSAPNTRYRGVMAQEVLETNPNAVYLFEDGYLGVHYGHLDVNMEMVK